VLPHHVRVEVSEHGDLVVAADRREDRADGRIGERRHEVLGTVRRTRRSPRGRILHRFDADDLPQPTEGLLMDGRVPLRRRP
jgi:hypothetical protein